MNTYPSGTVAFLFTDIEGSTRRWESQQQAMRQAVERHFELIRAEVNAAGGVLFKMIGDATQAAFPTVPSAIAASVAAQAALRAETWGDIGPIRVRMAIHAGEATPQAGDYLAPALNRLARVLSSGYGEQVLLTETARSLVAGQLPPDHTLKDLGAHKLRDLLVAEHVYQLAGPGLPVEFPPLKSLDLRPNNLPAQPTVIVGRETELAAIQAMLSAPGTRFVTLTGPGGSGKTRLALQAAADALDAFPDGVWWIPLAAITEPELVPQAIATPLGVREVPGQPLMSTLVEHLKPRRTLLVLDNLEQVTDSAPLLARLLDEAPGLIVLATSRQPLRLRAEREFDLDPLPLPAPQGKVTAEEARASPAVRLFVERAQAVKSTFSLDGDNAADIVAICRRLDGLPLAIELAAARMRVLSPSALLARLDRRLSILTGGARDLPARQQTLRATIEWSYDLLSEPERDLFAYLAVFSGGCTYDAAQSVCDDVGGLTFDLLDGLESLVQKSLLRRDDGASDDARFIMLQTILEFAREKLAYLPQGERVRQAHANMFLMMTEATHWDDFSSQVDLLNRFEADYANLRQAIAFYEAQGAGGTSQRIRLATSLVHFWLIRGYIDEGRRILATAIAESDASGVIRSDALSGAAVLAEAAWDLDQATRYHEAALEEYRRLGDLRGTARSVSGLGTIARLTGDLDRAQALHQEAHDVWRSLADKPGQAGALLDLGVLSHLRGDQPKAEQQISQSLELFAALKDLAGEASAHQWLGIVDLALGALDAAMLHFRESLQYWRQTNNQQMLAADLGNLGEVHHLAGSLDAAEPLYREALASYEGITDQMGSGFILSQLGRLAIDRKQTSEALSHLQRGLRLRWDAGDMGGVADTLDALAEATLASGDLDIARQTVTASESLRQQTGLARLPVYAARYETVRAAVGSITTVTAGGIDELIQAILARPDAR